MALSKILEIDNTGIVASYFKLSEVLIQRRNGGEVITLGLDIYGSKESRDIGKDPIDRKYVDISNEAILNMILSIGYSELKKLDIFKEAQDV
jgi:hypothetical protein